MTATLYLAVRYLAYHRAKTSILVASIALIAFLPAGLSLLARESAERLTSRADATPLLIGARGSPLELVLRALYFESDVPAEARWADALAVRESGLAEALPLLVRFRAEGVPIVGTSLEYLDFRRLEVAHGRRMALLGEAVLGAGASERLGIDVDDFVVSSPETLFDLGGTYPLRLRVVGVLAPSFGPDDDAIFVDVKTTWVIAGLVHGHGDLHAPDARGAVLSRDGERVTANASVVEYNEITPENVDSFHFHGDPSAYPLTAVIAVPEDLKSLVLLRGRYEDPRGPAQAVRPVDVIDELLGTVFTIQAYVVAGFAVVGSATLATAGLVFLLSLRLRRREVETLVKLGGSRARVATLLASELVFVLGAGLVVAAVLTLSLGRFGGGAIRAVLLS